MVIYSIIEILYINILYVNKNNIKCTFSTGISIMPWKTREFKNKTTAGVYIE